jgi:mannan endo-1,4-beta-mannosidase
MTRGLDFDRRSLLLGLAAAAAPIGIGDAVAAHRPGFVRRKGTRLTRDGKPYRYAGANAWYLAWLGTDAAFGDRARMGRELDRLRALGVTNVRLLASAEEGPLRNAVRPGFVNRDGKLNEQLLIGLDHAMAEIGARGMTAVLYLTNFWEWSGGMTTLQWYETGQYIDANDPAHPWPAFGDASSQFYANQAAVARYFAYVRALVTRRNTVTGKKYSDDRALMAWQLCNEPRPGGSPAAIERNLAGYYRWIDDTAALIRGLDRHHLISLGMEGTIACAGRAEIVARAHQNIDYLTAHVWPLNWGWVNGKDLAGTWEGGRARVLDYVGIHVRLASEVGKPLVIEEFGFPRDGELYDPAATTMFRERYYRLIYSAAEASLMEDGPVAGTNFWAWNGEARAAHADSRFKDGDTQFMGDPPHEPQGWYGNFDTDTAMQAVIREHAVRFVTG